jgi:hypothetical protein
MPPLKSSTEDYALVDQRADFNLSVQLVPLKKHFTKKQLDELPLTTPYHSFDSADYKSHLALLHSYCVHHASEHHGTRDALTYEDISRAVYALFYKKAYVNIPDFDPHRLSISRLCHTNPTCVTPKMPLTKVVILPSIYCRIHFAAIRALGSYYKKHQQPKITSLLKPAPQPKPSSSSTVVSEDALSIDSSEPDLSTILPSKAPTKAPRSSLKPPATATLLPTTPPASAIAATITPPVKKTPPSSTYRHTPTTPAPIPKRSHHLRMKYKMHLPPVATSKADGHKTVREALRHLLVTMFTQFQTVDPTCVLLPWASDSRQSPITSPDLLLAPHDTDKQKAFYYRLGSLSFDRHVWFSLHWSFDGPQDNFWRDGMHKAWFSDGDHMTWPHAIHDADDEIDIGILTWSGSFLDPARIIRSINKTYTDPDGNQTHWQPYSLGLQLKYNRSLEAPRDDPDRTNWYGADCPAPHRPFTVYCSAPHAHQVKDILIRAFNRHANFRARAGQYDIAYLPAPHLCIGGHDSTESALDKRGSLLKQHTTIVLGLRTLDLASILALDAPVAFTGPLQISVPSHLQLPSDPVAGPGRFTLRDLLLCIPFPLSYDPNLQFFDHLGQPRAPNPSDRLFNSIDRVPAFNEGQKFQATILQDRVQLAQKFIHALPAWINSLFGPIALKAWILRSSHSLASRFRFGVDDNNMWVGTWTSAADSVYSDIASLPHAPMFHFENLRMVHTANDSNPFQRDPRFQPFTSGEASLGPQSTGTSPHGHNTSAPSPAVLPPPSAPPPVLQDTTAVPNTPESPTLPDHSSVHVPAMCDSSSINPSTCAQEQPPDADMEDIDSASPGAPLDPSSTIDAPMDDVDPTLDAPALCDSSTLAPSTRAPDEGDSSPPLPALCDSSTLDPSTKAPAPYPPTDDDAISSLGPSTLAHSSHDDDDDDPVFDPSYSYFSHSDSPPLRHPGAPDVTPPSTLSLTSPPLALTDTAAPTSSATIPDSDMLASSVLAFNVTPVSTNSPDVFPQPSSPADAIPVASPVSDIYQATLSVPGRALTYLNPMLSRNESFDSSEWPSLPTANSRHVPSPSSSRQSPNHSTKLSPHKKRSKKKKHKQRASHHGVGATRHET